MMTMIVRHAHRSALVDVIRSVQKVVRKGPDDEARELSTRQERVYRYSIVSVWFVVTLLIALCVPNIGYVISLLGGLAATFIFLFPGL